MDILKQRGLTNEPKTKTPQELPGQRDRKNQQRDRLKTA